MPQLPQPIIVEPEPFELNLPMPDKCSGVLFSNAEYKILRGGRGSAKSWSIARYIIYKCAFGRFRVLCTREMQNSIRDSVYRLLVDQIEALKLQKYFIVQKDGISSMYGSEILFKGLKHNISGIRSTEGIDICWIEEAEVVSDDSWMLLIPTIRKTNSEILISYNPEIDGSPTDLRFCKHIPPKCAWAEVNFEDNPWLPEKLLELQAYDKRVDFEKWEHVWRGKYKKYADALIFKGKIRVEDFETPPGVQLYYGSDFGFSNDPSVLVRMFILDNRLYIDYEAYGIGVEIARLHHFFASVPDANKWRITADSQRPDTISFLSQYFKDPKDGTEYPGYDIAGAEKGKGSVEDGIEFLRSFEAIIIHPRCRGAADNFTNYKWKQDKLTQAILPEPAEGSDHVPDACRYALERYIKKKVSVFDINYNKLNVIPES